MVEGALGNQVHFAAVHEFRKIHLDVIEREEAGDLAPARTRPGSSHRVGVVAAELRSLEPKKRLMRRLQSLGYHVTLEAA